MKTWSSARMKTVHCRLLATVLLAFASGAGLAQQVIVGVDWTRPGAEWSAYDAFLLRPLGLDDTRVLKPVWAQDDPEPWDFEPGAAEAVQEMFRRIVSEELTLGGRYSVVNEPGPGVLEIDMEFLSVTPYFKPGVPGEPEYVVTTVGSGDVVVSAEFRDSRTGTVIALIEGERIIGTEYGDATRESFEKNLEETFRDWGRRIRQGVETAQGE